MRCSEQSGRQVYYQNNMQREEREGRWMKTPQLCLFLQVRIFTMSDRKRRFCIF